MADSPAVPVPAVPAAPAGSSTNCSTVVIVLSIVIAVLAIVAIIIGAVYTSKTASNKRVASIGPAWTRGEIEAPEGRKDMGSWTAAVYTNEQQQRLGVNALGDKTNTSIHDGLGSVGTDDIIPGALSNIPAQGVHPTSVAPMDTWSDEPHPLPIPAQAQAQQQAQAQAQAQQQQAQAQQAQAQAQQAQAQAQQQAQARQQAQAQRQAEEAKGTYSTFGDNIRPDSERRKAVSSSDRAAMNSAAASITTAKNGLDDNTWMMQKQKQKQQTQPSTAAAHSIPSGIQMTGGEPLITAEQAMAMIQNPQAQSTIIVAMNGCPGCEMLRETLNRLLASGDVSVTDRVGVLEKREWMKIMDKLPAAQVPALFKVGRGSVDKGPVGNQDPAPLIAFIKYAA